MNKAKSLTTNVSITAIAGVIATSLLSAVPAAANGCSLSGSGTQVDPYLVANYADFTGIPSCDGSGVYFKQTASFSLFNEGNHTPIDLDGHYDGEGHYISDLTVDVGGFTGAGLFDGLGMGASVSNLEISQADVSGSAIAGVLAGSASSGSVIENVFIVGATVTADEDGLAGGLVGSATDLTLIDVYVQGLVGGSSRAGGVVGEYWVESPLWVSNVVFGGAIWASSSGEVPTNTGGLFGTVMQKANLTLEDSGTLNFDTGNDTSSPTIAGGLIGVNYLDSDSDLNITFDNVFSSMFVEPSVEDAQVGGLIGRVVNFDVGPAPDISLDVNRSYSRLYLLSDPNPDTTTIADIANFEDRLIVTTSVTNDYVVGGFGESSALISYSQGTTAPEEPRDMARLDYWIDLGWDALDGRSNDAIVALERAPEWYMWSDAVALVPDGILGLLESTGWLDLSHMAQGATPVVSYTATAASWVDVDVSDRVYVDPLGDSRDDYSFIYAPPGATCTDGFQEIPADAYPNGFFLPIREDPYADEVSMGSSTYCSVAGENIYFSADGDYQAGFSLGFDFFVGGKTLTEAFVSTNGNLSFTPDVDNYDETLYEHSGDTSSTVFSALMADQEFVVGESSMWAARTTIEGNNAAVFAWENMAIFPQDETRPRGELASYQVVLVELSPGTVEVWFNYDTVIIEEGNSAGYDTHLLHFNLADDVTVGSNIIQVAEARLAWEGCAEFEGGDSSIVGSITDSTFDDLGGTYYAKVQDQNSYQVALFTDAACEQPFEFAALQDEVEDGFAVIEALESDFTGESGLPIGYGSWPVSDEQEFVYRDYLLNVPMTELVDGGAIELISLSIGTDVPGRIVSSFSAPETEESSPAPAAPYRGPVISDSAKNIAAGDSVTFVGSNLSSVTGVEVADQLLEASATESSITFTVPADLAAGTYDIVVLSSSGRLMLSEMLIVSSAGASVDIDEVIGSVKRIGDTARIFATNIIGAGKVQLFVNGREIAWVRAVDETDPKLRYANDTYYLVRRVDLAEGKNVIEIYADGERVRRTAYTK